MKQNYKALCVSLSLKYLKIQTFKRNHLKRDTQSQIFQKQNVKKHQPTSFSLKKKLVY